MKQLMKSSLLKNSSVYIFAEVINKSIPFLLLPILTTYLSQEEYGIVSMFNVLLAFLVPFFSLNVHGAINRKYFDKEEDFPAYISTSLIILLISSVITSFLLILFSDLIQNVSGFPSQYIYMVVIAAFSSSIITILLGLFRVKEKPHFFGLFQISNTALNFIISIVFVVSLGMGWQGRVSGQVISFGLFSLLAIILIINMERVRWRFNNGYAQEIVKFGVPLIPHIIGMTIITMSDRIFITNMVGLDEAGVYTVGFQIGMIMQVLVNSFNNAWSPYLYKNLKLNDWNKKKKIVKIVYFYNIIVLGIAFAISAIAPLLINYLIGKSFQGAVIYVFWITLGFAFSGMYKMITNFIIYERKTHLTSIVTFFTALMNLVLNYFLIKANGPVGAAQATAASFFISYLLTWIVAMRVHKMPWNLLKESST